MASIGSRSQLEDEWVGSRRVVEQSWCFGGSRKGSERLVAGRFRLFRVDDATYATYSTLHASALSQALQAARTHGPHLKLTSSPSGRHTLLFSRTNTLPIIGQLST